MAKSTGDKWEIWNVGFQTPVFGMENTYSKDVKWMMISTKGGESDATAACKKYHPGCRVVCTLSRLEYATPGVADEVVKLALSRLEGGTQ